MLLSFLNGMSRILTLLRPAALLDFHKIDSNEELALFQREFWKRDGVMFPEAYLKAGSCFLVRNKFGELVGTFAIIHDTTPRTLLQVPEHFRNAFLNSLKPRERVVETTAVWLKKQKYHFIASVTFWVRMFTEIYGDGRTVNVFSCDTRKPRLERTYSQGAGGVVYRGPIEALPGMEDNGAQEEVVFFQRFSDCMRGFLKEMLRRGRKTLSKPALPEAASSPVNIQ